MSHSCEVVFHEHGRAFTWNRYTKGVYLAKGKRINDSNYNPATNENTARKIANNFLRSIRNA